MKAVTEVAQVAIMAVREADNLVNNARSVHAASRSGSPALKHCTFSWKAGDKYLELCKFEIRVKNIFMTNRYNIQESERVLKILNWLGKERLQFVQTLNDEEQEKCRTSTGFLEV